ncbi:undecaprenyl-diphosphate phosphatase [Lentisphaerota bacterium WC36G]|nr:undecaprenyl-diphosphate phosphatase [Lentisphaerae bacterium WC36]
MVDYIKIIFLAIFQGVSEFLPISSSGHLLILKKIIAWNVSSAEFINILLHAGTLLSILIFYSKLLLDILKDFNTKLISQIIIGSIPIFVAGFIVKYSFLKNIISESSLITGIGFIFSAIIIYVSSKNYEKKLLENEHLNDPKNHFSTLENLTFSKVLVIGFMQAVAILPGVSRSGSTISMGLMLKLKKEDCARFSFLLAIPAIAGAVGSKILDIVGNSSEEWLLSFDIKHLALYAVGFVVSAVVGFFSLKFLLKVLQKGKLQYFSYYLLIIGAVTIVCSLIKLLNT